MLDLETYSTRPNAVILTIGAVRFERVGPLGSFKSLEKTGDVFYRRIDAESCVKLGCHTDPNTLRWWQRQGAEARKEIEIKEDRIPIEQALREFSEWVGEEKTECMWANGSDFDCTILREAYTLTGLEAPWKFWNSRDTRTLYDLGDVRLKDFPNDILHHAAHDCYNQVKAFHAAMERLGFEAEE